MNLQETTALFRARFQIGKLKLPAGFVFTPPSYQTTQPEAMLSA